MEDGRLIGWTTIHSKRFTWYSDILLQFLDFRRQLWTRQILIVKSCEEFHRASFAHLPLSIVKAKFSLETVQVSRNVASSLARPFEVDRESSLSPRIFT